MVDKELTIFVVDLAAPKRLFEYLLHTVAAKLIRGLKTDYLSVVLFHSPTTSHSSASSGQFKGVNVLIEFEQASYDKLRLLYWVLVREGTKSDLLPGTSDFVQATLFSTTLLAPTKNKAFIRNIVLISAVCSPINRGSAEKILSLANFRQDMPVNLYVIASGLNFENGAEIRLMEDQFTKFQIFSDLEAHEIINHYPPVKKTRPISVFKGDLRLGADFDRVLHDPNYFPEQDNSCITLKVDVYPAAKSDTFSSGTHEYILEDNAVVKLERKTKHFVWEKNFQAQSIEDDEVLEKIDKEFDKVDVEPSQFTPGFKFSNYDLMALDNDLKKAATLKLDAALDVLGILDVDSVPFAYLTGEALYVIPEKDSTMRNVVNQNAFCLALLQERRAILARFVRRTGKEVEVGVMFPVRVRDNKLYNHSFIFIRLPFKEDKKVGDFVKLSGADALVEEEKKSVDLNILNELMESFIETRTLPEPQNKENTMIDNSKVIMKTSDSSKLLLKPKQRPTYDLYASDPGVNKYLVGVRKLILKSLEFGNLRDMYSDPKSVAKDLFGSGDTSFFDLENVLALNAPLQNPKIFLELAQKGQSASKRLVEEIGTAFVRKEDFKKRKQTRDHHFQANGSYGAEEKEYDTAPDFVF